MAHVVLLDEQEAYSLICSVAKLGFTRDCLPLRVPALVAFSLFCLLSARDLCFVPDQLSSISL